MKKKPDRELRVANEAAMKTLAAALSGESLRGKSVGFSGPLGAGKTTLIRFMAAALGSADPVSSPTFTLEHEYQAPGLRIEHWDLYRLHEIPEELFEPVDADACRFIEWPEKFDEIASSLDIRIAIEFENEEDKTRLVKIYYAGAGASGQEPC